MKRMGTFAAAVGIALAAALANSADAAIVYNLENVTLNDGGTLTGTFTTDDLLTTLLSADVQASGGYDYVVPSANNLAVTLNSTVLYIQTTNANVLQLAFSSLAAVGSTSILTGGASYEYEQLGPGVRYVTGGAVRAVAAAVPEPSSVLSAASAAAVGLAGAARRRHRRRAASRPC